jgi:hypothetical protein
LRPPSRAARFETLDNRQFAVSFDLAIKVVILGLMSSPEAQVAHDNMAY